MSTTNSEFGQPLTRSTTALIRGGAVGVAVAFGFALVIRVLPEKLFEPQSAWLVVMFVVGAVAAAPSVWLVAAVTRQRGRHLGSAVDGAMCGALAFDGIAIGFAPGLYGQTEMGSVGAFLLSAFCCLGVAGVLLAKAPRD